MQQMIECVYKSLVAVWYQTKAVSPIEGHEDVLRPRRMSCSIAAMIQLIDDTSAAR